MKVYFDEETDKRLMEAKTKEEVEAILASVPDAGSFGGSVDLVMAEIEKIKGAVEEMGETDIDQIAGGAKLKRVDLSESQGCMATFNLADLAETENRPSFNYCGSNDFCYASNEYDYHYTKWSNCPSGGKHAWTDQPKITDNGSYASCIPGATCSKCKYFIGNIMQGICNFYK
ncbi:MAG: hypothetical protein J6Z43_09115 [Clostridiales bacterium]|nr:hypothetical protein [Clostridiales bacterium]